METQTAQGSGPLRPTPPESSDAERQARRTLRGLRVVVLVVAVPLVVLALVLGVLLFLRPWGSDVPPAAENPALPGDVTITSTETLCGSGGCWRELTLQGRLGEAPTALAGRLGLTDEVCHEQPGLTPRRVCAEAQPLDDQLVVRVRYPDVIG